MLGWWVGFDEDSSGHWIYFPDKQNVSIKCSVKFDAADVKVYLPQVVSTEGEQKKSTIEQPSKPSEQRLVQELIESIQEPIEATDVVNSLRDNFRKQLDIEGCPKCIWQESTAVKHLHSSEGVISNLPKECGQLPKGIQEVTGDDEASTMAAVAIAEVDEIEPSYEEACLRSDWPEWRRAMDVELQNLELAETWDVVERPSSINIVDPKWVFCLKKDSEEKIIKWKGGLPKFMR